MTTELRYTTEQASGRFGVARQTIINWAETFERYLSPSANPGRSRTRFFTVDDMTVFDLVATSKAAGLTYEEIAQALERGQRGQAPAETPEEMTVMLAADVERQLTAQIDLLNRKVADLNEENARLRQAEHDLIETRATLAVIRQQLERAEGQEQNLQEQIQRLMKDLGRAEATIEALQKQLPKE
jgi:DNA-binding transcriptional MerR regulator